jgi:hypothetical protein
MQARRKPMVFSHGHCETLLLTQDDVVCPQFGVEVRDLHGHENPN